VILFADAPNRANFVAYYGADIGYARLWFHKNDPDAVAWAYKTTFYLMTLVFEFTDMLNYWPSITKMRASAARIQEVLEVPEHATTVPDAEEIELTNVTLRAPGLWPADAFERRSCGPSRVSGRRRVSSERCGRCQF
jgi:hypothetical protein